MERRGEDNFQPWI